MSFSDIIYSRIEEYEKPHRIALSTQFPVLKKPIIFLRSILTELKNKSNSHIKTTHCPDYFPHIVARHQSLLRRKLGSSDPNLQEQKIINLRQAIKKIDGQIIHPGDIFSFWVTIGKPKYENGYVDGMILANGKVNSGLGGGLCQLSNFLYWILLHTPIEIVEHHHHSLDVFPDSGRVLPFGTGATVLYNFIDLKIKNISPSPLQIKIWLTKTHLKGQILSPVAIPTKYHVYEKNHIFVNRNSKYFRYNEIYRDTLVDGRIVNSQKISTNFAPVLYDVTSEFLKQQNIQEVIL